MKYSAAVWCPCVLVTYISGMLFGALKREYVCLLSYGLLLNNQGLGLQGLF